MDLVGALELALAGIAAGTLGSMLGIGGGLIVIPALTNLFHFEFEQARAAGLLVVIATSCGVAAATGRERFANIRLGLTLAAPTALVALLSAHFLHGTKDTILYVLFSGVLLAVAVLMWRPEPLEDTGDGNGEAEIEPPGALDGAYHDPKLGRDVAYRVRRTPAMVAVSATAGMVSALLGVGGGVFQVPAMALLGGAPIRVASATSNFILGITAAASLPTYIAKAHVRPLETAAVVLGVLAGAFLGSALARRLRGTALRRIFSAVVLFLAYTMIRKALP
jgi:uncharacterized membrane protein YfcA